MNQNDTYRNYLFDVGYYIKERAIEAVKERDKKEKGSSEYEFQSGRIMAFNEVVSIMQQHAEGFGISLESLQLADIEPDRDLV
jgi:hypothetical protein